MANEWWSSCSTATGWGWMDTYIWMCVYRKMAKSARDKQKKNNFQIRTFKGMIRIATETWLSVENVCNKQTNTINGALCVECQYLSIDDGIFLINQTDVAFDLALFVKKISRVLGFFLSQTNQRIERQMEKNASFKRWHFCIMFVCVFSYN